MLDVSYHVCRVIRRFITAYITGGYIFTLYDSIYPSTNFFLNLLSFMLTLDLGFEATRRLDFTRYLQAKSAPLICIWWYVGAI
jgi:hypothetical protein